jgi:hypothetical protein
MRDTVMTTLQQPSLTRRRLLAMVGGVTAVGILTACGDSDDSTSSGSDQVVGHFDSSDSDFAALFAEYEPADEPDGDPDMIVWPDYVLSSPMEVQELYAFHVANGAVMRYIPCFCGCGGSSDHRNNRDCYVKEVHADGSITFDPMAPT